MIALAHIGGLPLEEILPAAAGTGTGLLFAHTWLMSHFRRREDER